MRYSNDSQVRNSIGCSLRMDNNRLREQASETPNSGVSQITMWVICLEMRELLNDFEFEHGDAMGISASVSLSSPHSEE
jgi:hypothetical protein